MPVVSTGPPIFVDSDGFIYLPGQPPLKWIITPNPADPTQVILQAILKDVGANVQRVLVETTDVA